MKRFEYKKLLNANTDTLNELGKEGWELVGVSDFVFYLKRELIYGE